MTNQATNWRGRLGVEGILLTPINKYLCVHEVVSGRRACSRTGSGKLAGRHTTTKIALKTTTESILSQYFVAGAVWLGAFAMLVFELGSGSFLTYVVASVAGILAYRFYKIVLVISILLLMLYIGWQKSVQAESVVNAFATANSTVDMLN